MKFIKFFLFALLILVSANQALAQENIPVSSGSNIQSQSDAFNSEAGFQSTEIGSIIALLIKVVLGFLAIIFLVLMILAGFKWMTAAGNEDQVKKAQATIKMAVIGLLIVLAAYGVTYFIFNKLPFSIATGPQGGGSGVNP